MTVAAQVLTLLATLQHETDAGLVLITHDFGVVARLADDVVVRARRSGGRACAGGEGVRPPARPLHGAAAGCGSSDRRSDAGLDTLLLRRGALDHRFAGAVGHRPHQDVRSHVALPAAADRRGPGRQGCLLRRGSRQTLAIVGESGSGKSTTLHEIMGFSQPPGVVRLTGVDPSTLRGRAARALRKQISIVFQDPAGRLDPRMTARDVVAEPLRVAGAPATRRMPASLSFSSRSASTRIRSTVPTRLLRRAAPAPRDRPCPPTEPAVIALDEPLSALDVSIQADILDLLMQVQADTGVAYLLVAHDLAVVRRIAHRVAVMKSGEIVEMGTVADIFERPEHPYTRSLIAAVPPLDPRRARVEGDEVCDEGGDMRAVLWRCRADSLRLGCRLWPRLVVGNVVRAGQGAAEPSAAGEPCATEERRPRRRSWCRRSGTCSTQMAPPARWTSGAGTTRCSPSSPPRACAVQS